MNIGQDCLELSILFVFCLAALPSSFAIWTLLLEIYFILLYSPPPAAHVKSLDYGLKTPTKPVVSASSSPLKEVQVSDQLHRDSLQHQFCGSASFSPRLPKIRTTLATPSKLDAIFPPVPMGQMKQSDFLATLSPLRISQPQRLATPPASSVAKSLFASASPAASVLTTAAAAFGQRTPTPLKRYLAAFEEKEGALKWNLTPLGTPQDLKDRTDVMKVRHMTINDI